MIIIHLDNTESQHPWIQPQIPLYLVRDTDGAVELEDEVVALEVLGLVGGAGPREVEDAPVGEGAD
jgi:hypothetical protein